jgi:hypothetical protein
VTILTIGILLLGAVFGRFFKVWILVPACAVTFIIVFASSACYGQGPLWALLEFAMLATCLQIGYMTGLIGGVTLRKPRESSCPAAPIAAARHRQPY